MKANEFVSCLFGIQASAHIAHLQSKSYSEHMALDGLYNGMTDHIDAFVEAYQGKYGIIKKYSMELNEGGEFKEYLILKTEEVEQFRATVKEGFLQQLIDNIQELLHTTIYKLTFLK